MCVLLRLCFSAVRQAERKDKTEDGVHGCLGGTGKIKVHSQLK